MMNNNHKNSGCGFAEELISYLYGESNEAESAAFETHLETCRACSAELDAFSGVHYSINDWKLKEFAVLETPRIEIPYPAAPKVEVSSAKGSWLSGFRQLFSLSPAWSLATASVAVFAVAVGIIFFALNSPNGNDIAGANKNSKNVTTAPTVEKTPETANTNSNENPSTDKAIKPLDEPKAPAPELAVEQNTKNSRAVRAANNQRQTQKSENTNAPKNNDLKRNPKTNKDAAPPVIPDEDEDDSLRLAELFEEIDTKE
jgi:hypothetical protein